MLHKNWITVDFSNPMQTLRPYITMYNLVCTLHLILLGEWHLGYDGLANEYGGDKEHIQNDDIEPSWEW
jgi:hypothetical protein